MEEGWIHSVVRELRSHMLPGVAKKKKEFKNYFGRHFSSLTAGFKVTDLL